MCIELVDDFFGIEVLVFGVDFIELEECLVVFDWIVDFGVLFLLLVNNVGGN